MWTQAYTEFRRHLRGATKLLGDFQTWNQAFGGLPAKLVISVMSVLMSLWVVLWQSWVPIGLIVAVATFILLRYVFQNQLVFGNPIGDKLSYILPSILENMRQIFKGGIEPASDNLSSIYHQVFDALRNKDNPLGYLAACAVQYAYQ